MTELVIYSFCAYGLAYIIGESKISLPLRLFLEPPLRKEPEPPPVVPPMVEYEAERTVRARIVEAPPKISWLNRCFDSIRLAVLSLIECPACFGTWAGFIYGLWFAPSFVPAGIRGAVLLGLYTCGSNSFLSRLGGKGG